jgi:hypothetical protein
MLTSASIDCIVAWPVSLDGWDHLGSWNCRSEKIPRVRRYWLDQAILTLTAAEVPAERQQVAFRVLLSSPGMYWVECACREWPSVTRTSHSVPCRDSRRSDIPQ